jgi:hypothetical protein
MAVPRVLYALPILVIGALLPGLTHGTFTRGSLNVVVPVQTWFGPPAFLLYLWLRRRHGPERTMAQFLAADGAEPATARLRPAPAHVAAAGSDS